MDSRHENEEMKIQVTTDGPYIIHGNIPLREQVVKNGKFTDKKVFEHRRVYALCRCGHSTHKPFCDLSHAKYHFKGTETADKTQTETTAKTETTPEIMIINDPLMHCGGPLYVKGGIPIQAADGTFYKTGNRVALCRCGKSANKPFCDSPRIAALLHDDADKKQ